MNISSHHSRYLLEVTSCARDLLPTCETSESARCRARLYHHSREVSNGLLQEPGEQMNCAIMSVYITESEYACREMSKSNRCVQFLLLQPCRRLDMLLARSSNKHSRVGTGNQPTGHRMVAGSRPIRYHCTRTCLKTIHRCLWPS
jgi:hypothetical protein